MLGFNPKIHRSAHSFDTVMESADKWANRLSESDKKKHTETLEHGAGMLDTPAQLRMYMHKYGKIHQSKLLQAYQHLPYEIWRGDRLSVIDYGCGQGIAEMVLSDYLTSICVDNDYVSDIHLVEPSTACLRQAGKYATDFFTHSGITLVNKSDKQLNENDVKPDSNLALHILSNVVDLDGFDGTRIIDMLNSDTLHHNVVLCVGPFYQENGRGDRMDRFGRQLKGFITLYRFQKHTDEWEKDYSCQLRIWSNRH